MASDEESGARVDADVETWSHGTTRGPELSIVVPVNAQSDQSNIHTLLDDLDRYGGPYDIETVVVLNNYPKGQTPPGLEELESRDVRVLTVPRPPRKKGEAIVMAARMPGIAAAKSENVVTFDADCRVPNATALLNWYVQAFQDGAKAAYTRVGHHDYRRTPSVLFVFAVHHFSRWFKRVVLRIPATRGSNYAVKRDLMVRFHRQGLLADDLNVGPTFKKLAGRVAYAAKRDLKVLTSGRVFSGQWKRILPYFLYRLRYNVRVLPVREDVLLRTGRENDSVRSYRHNGPITAEDR